MIWPFRKRNPARELANMGHDKRRRSHTALVHATAQRMNIELNRPLDPRLSMDLRGEFAAIVPHKEIGHIWLIPALCMGNTQPKEITPLEGPLNARA